ncbi:hypothetical protein L218DRAFT_1063140 [Marasmius fiardii PR-910]|nr:hypothetical protein L218DRAFT_1063140 [Marasmius fiardii PR-910]
MSATSTNHDVIIALLEHGQWHAYLELFLPIDAYPPSRRRLYRVLNRPSDKHTIQNRYFPFASQTINVVSHIATGLDYPANLYLLLGSPELARIIQNILTDSIAWHCVCALYMNLKRIRWPLLGLLIVSIFSATAVLGVVGSQTRGTSEIASGRTLCLVYTQYHNFWLYWAPIFVYEFTTLVLVAKKYYGYLMDSNHTLVNSPLVRLVIKEMVFYLFLVFLLFTGNEVLFANPDPSLTGLLIPVALVVLSILRSRMLFSLLKESGSESVVVAGDPSVQLETWHAAPVTERTIPTTHSVA